MRLILTTGSAKSHLLILSSLLSLIFLWPCHAFVSPSSSSPLAFLALASKHTKLYNILQDIGDMLTGHGSQLDAQDGPLPYGECFCPKKSLSDQVQTLAVQERLWSLTGEDFDIVEAFSGRPFINVRGAVWHLPGKDKMRLLDADDHGRELLVLDRKLMAARPTYDIYRGQGSCGGGGGGEKIGWIEKKLVAMTDTFDVYMEGKGGFGVTGLFKPPPAYSINGDFIDRNLVMRNEAGQVVARVAQDWAVEIDNMNHYQVQVAPGMDSILVVACLCAIDEEFEEEHKAKKQKQEQE